MGYFRRGNDILPAPDKAGRLGDVGQEGCQGFLLDRSGKADELTHALAIRKGRDELVDQLIGYMACIVERTGGTLPDKGAVA